jgi:PAS domain S-box-containing protein
MEASQKEFEFLIKESPIAITLLKGKDFLFKVVNNAALQMMGKTELEVKDRPLFDVFPDLSKSLSVLDSVFSSGITYEEKEVEVKFERFGKKFHGFFDLTFKPWLGSDGMIKGVMGVCIDVSKSVQEKRKIEERERLYKTITENTPDLIYVFDLNYRFTYANEALLNMLGRSWDEVVGKGLVENGYESWHADMHEREIDHVISTKKPMRGEFSFSHASLGDRTYDYILIPVIDKNGNVEAITGTSRDITDIKKTQENLKESEEQFRIFGNNIQNLAWIADGEGNIFWYNQRWFDYTGLSFDEMKEQGWQKVLHPDHHDDTLEKLENLWSKNEPFELIFPLKRHDGQYCWFLTRGVPIADDQGKVYRWIGTNTDIHDRIETEQKLKESEQRYNNLILSSPFGIGLLEGEELVITTANEPILEIWGKGKEMLGKKYFEALPELVRQGYPEVFTKVYKTGIPFNAYETPVTLIHNGEEKTRYYDFVIFPQRNIKKEVKGIGIIVTEVTSQAILNKNIKESAIRFATTVHQAPVAISVLKGEDYVVEVANEKQLELWGVTKEQVLNQPLFPSIPDGKGKGFEELLGEVLRTGKSYKANEYCFEITRNDVKETLFINFVYEPLYGENNKIEGILSVATDVTEQVLVRKKIEQSEANYKSLIEAAPMGIGVFMGRELRIENPNEAFIQIVGKGPDIVGKRLTDVMPELVEHGQPYLKILDEVFNTGINYRSYGDLVKIEQEGVMRDGYYDINYVPLFDDKGKVYAILDIAADVTDIIKAQIKIEESEKRFRSIADESPIFVFIIEPGEYPNISYWNKTWLEYTGKTMDDSLGSAWEETVHTDDIPAALKIYKNSYNSKKPFLIPAIRTKRHNGDYRYFSYKGIPRYLPDGTFMGYVGVGFDVHEQKIAETILAEREEKFRSLVQTLPQLVWVTDAKGSPEFASFRWEEYSGIDFSNEKNWKSIVHPDDYERLNLAWEHSVERGKFHTIDVRLKSKSGEYKWHTVKGEPVLDIKNNIVKWVGAFTDIHTEKLFTKELEVKVKERTEELQQFNIELERKNKDLQSFAYISSHDLQEPLRKIQTFASRIVVKEYDNLSEYGKDNFNRMQNSAKRMQTLIQDLLSYSKTNSAERIFEKVDLNLLVEEVKGELWEDLKEKNAFVEADNLCYANVIPFQFRQLFVNLLSNSLKFSKPEVPPYIKIEAKIAKGKYLENEKLSPNSNYCHISVSDNGIGFESQYSEKIFEVFQRLHGKNEYKGTGIGLSIVKKIVENHNGIICAKGELNKGATFNIYIPA